MSVTPPRYEPIEFIDFTPKSDGQGGRLPDVEDVFRTFGKIEVQKEKRNYMTNEVILPERFTVTFYVRKAYEPKAETRVRFRGGEYTIQSKNWVDASRKEWILTLLGNGKSSTTPKAEA